ncbi:hypothetical protein Fleli_2244 [Bernardetia litoralis DSM 6794]|uniref:Uncharacterized protein n=1 Tax=Bernardetia litoralis (strain ATCC 23117 / DSM 6794 / NBRC 15988 / NCIMB 1366 / Fx l1 / Sio-4) TaxID=880071 RepID=I4AKY6_BERLS|nr:hypothetical protein [Bernardetia litoralis]AFM04621.1 hypothetical protein Fleli_2244 [Bernardetia litoralis DSM 6794]
MAKNNTLADLDAFLKEQETSENNIKKDTKKTVSSYTKEEFVNQNPHQIVETEILAQAGKTTKKEKLKIDTTVEIKTEKRNIASNHVNNFVPEAKQDDSTMMQWAKAIDETVKGSEMLRSVPLLTDITESGTEQLKATEKFLETSQNIWKKFWD